MEKKYNEDILQPRKEFEEYINRKLDVEKISENDLLDNTYQKTEKMNIELYQIKSSHFFIAFESQLGMIVTNAKKDFIE